MPQVTGQGTSITLENTIEAQFTKFETEGSSEQETRSGKNKYNATINKTESNVSSIADIQYFTLNGTSSADGRVSFGLQTLKAGTYTVNLKYISGSFSNSDNYDDHILRIWKGDSWDTFGTTINVNSTDKSQVSMTFTLEEDTEISLGAFYRVTDIYNNIKYAYQIVEGSNSDFDFEPYGASPSPDYPSEVKSCGDNGSINEKIKNADGTEEQDYSIPVQQPMRSIGDVRDCFVKKDDGWYERHYIGEYIANNDLPGNEMTDTLIGLLTPILNIAPGLTGINFTSIVRSNLLQNTIINNSGLDGTNGDSRIRVYLSKDFAKTFDEANAFLTNNKFKIEFVQKEPLDLPCTETQIQQLENKPSTYKDFTIIQSQDETPAYLEVSGIYDLNNLINN